MARSWVGLPLTYRPPSRATARSSVESHGRWGKCPVVIVDAEALGPTWQRRDYRLSGVCVGQGSFPESGRAVVDQLTSCFADERVCNWSERHWPICVEK